jgi:hypothetical protein
MAKLNYKKTEEVFVLQRKKLGGIDSYVVFGRKKDYTVA